MLTRNFLQMIANDAGLKMTDCPKGIDVNGDNNYSINFDSTTENYWQTKAKFRIGIGTTAPKVTDNKLENEISDGYSCTIAQKIYTIGDEKDFLNISSIITNTSTDNITFSEIGFFTSTLNNGLREFMLAREVYDTPITIAPGESVAVSVNII